MSHEHKIYQTCTCGMTWGMSREDLSPIYPDGCPSCNPRRAEEASAIKDALRFMLRGKNAGEHRRQLDESTSNRTVTDYRRDHGFGFRKFSL